MKQPLFLLLSLLLLCSCSKTDRTLDGIEQTMIVNAESAFEALANMDTTSMSESQKARRALLHAFMAIVWVTPADMTAADLNRATTSFDGHCTTDEVKSLIIKSEFAKAGGNPIIRLEMLKDGEFLASQLDDKPGLAFIYFYLANTYANGFNGIVSEYYADKALNLFNELGYKKQSIDARMSIVGALAVKRDYSAMLDSLLSMKSDVMHYSTESYKTYFLDQLARTLDENGRSDEAIDIWRGIYEADNVSANTLAHCARAYIHTNRLNSAEILINKAIALPHNVTDEYLCRNVQYDILQRLGRKDELPRIDNLRNKAASADYDNRKIAESSLALNQKYDSATQTAWNEIQSTRQRTIILSAVFLLVLLSMVGGLLFYRKRNRLLKVENENNLLRLKNLEDNLFDKERRQNDVAQKVSALFKSRFSTIDHLANVYFECKETTQEQKRILAETKAMIAKFGAEASLTELETIVNAANDNLFAHFTEDFPKLSVAQRKLALFIFCGLSLQSISIFLGADLRNIYVYKSRLKSTISKSDSPRKAQYLSYFS